MYILMDKKANQLLHKYRVKNFQSPWT